MKPKKRKAFLVLHIVAAGVWTGVTVLFGVMVIVGLTGDAAVQALAYRSIEAFLLWPMVASGVICLASGVVLGAGTKWGLVRFWWVAVKLALNLVLVALEVFVLRPQLPGVREHGEAIARGESPIADLSGLVFPPAVTLVALTLATVLSVYKPWGRVRATASTTSARRTART